GPSGRGRAGQQCIGAPALVVEGLFPAEVGFHGRAPALVRLLHHVIHLVGQTCGPGLDRAPRPLPRAHPPPSARRGGPVSIGPPAACHARTPPSSTRALPYPRRARVTAAKVDCTPSAHVTTTAWPVSRARAPVVPSARA